jgi:hypothetical protein
MDSGVRTPKSYGRIVDESDVPPASDEQEVLARIGRIDVA